LLLDDELPGLTYLKMLCEQIKELEVIRAFNNPTVFLKEINTLEFDLCILDIKMPEISGLQIANLLKGKPVIFTTAYKEFAAEAFDLDAIDYVRKPVKKERLQQAVQKAIQRIENKNLHKNFVQLNTDKGKTLIFFDQLAYITTSEKDSRDKWAWMQNNTSILLKNISLEKLLELLPPDKFCRVNKKEIIALSAVRFFSHNEITTSITLPDGKPLILILGEKYGKDFLRIVNP
jgi:DNA-binding LytR/AlgR family response regulator